MESEERHLSREVPGPEPGPPVEPAYDRAGLPADRLDPAYDPRYPMETVTSETDSSVVTRFSPARRAYEAIYLIFAVICALLILRIIMKLLAASTAAGFTGFVYGVTDVFMAPFRGLLPVFASGRNVFDFSAIIALLVYVLIGFLLSRLVAIMFMRDVTVAQRRRGRYRPY